MMRCPNPVLLEDHAEGLLSGREAEDVEAHLAGCGTCRRSVEERKRWLEVFGSLPQLEPPPGFARRVVESAFPAPARGRRLWPALAAGLASLSLVATLLVVTGVCDLPSLMNSSGKLAWAGLKDAASTGAKALRLVAAVFQSLAQLLRAVWNGIEALTGTVPPQVHVLALAAMAVLAGVSLLGYRKLFVRR